MPESEIFGKIVCYFYLKFIFNPNFLLLDCFSTWLHFKKNNLKILAKWN